MIPDDGVRHALFTGDRPNGPMHIGHYVGSIRSRLQCQGRHEQHIMIADQLALTDNVDDPSAIAGNVVQIGLDYLATGIDPDVNTIFIQSCVLELAALTTLYLNLVSAGELLDNPTRNEEVTRRGFGHDAPAGMFTYSVSQVADITAFDADLVPVGTDQVPLVRFSAMLVRKFNERFGPVIVEPAALVPDMGRLPGIDGHPKMGKSLNNAIYLSDSADVVRAKLSRIAMTAHGTQPGAAFDPATSPPFVYLREFHPDRAEVVRLEQRYGAATVGEDEIRAVLLDVMQAFLEPIRTRRAALADDRGEVLRLLQAGSERASEHAAKTLDRARVAMGLTYF